MSIMKLMRSLKPLTDRQVIGTLLQPMDVGREYVEGDNNYAWFYAIGKAYRPTSILEIGTRFGYSLKAFINGAAHVLRTITIHVYDAECDGIQTLKIFEDYFRNVLGMHNLFISKVNTRSVLSLDPAISVDLAMIDGDHSEDGCFKDCMLAWPHIKPGGVMVLDDADYPPARRGMMRFFDTMDVEPLEYLPSLRGIWLLKK